MLHKIKISKHRKYGRSYNENIIDTFEYEFGELKGNWLHTMSISGYKSKHLTTGKHFEGFTFEGEISEPDMIKLIEARKQKIADAEAEIEKERIANIKKAKEIRSKMPDAVASVIHKIRSIIFLENLKAVARKDKEAHQFVNENVISLVGYIYAKHCGWYNVLNEIIKQY